MENKRKQLFHALIQFAVFITLLEIARVLYSGNIGFFFLLWNLFLAIIPLVISYQLLKIGTGSKLENISCFLIWLVILPNAPYLVTDLLHFGTKNDMPDWFDMVLLFSFALFGLLSGVVSMLYMFQHLQKYWNAKYLKVLMPVVFFACGFGVYIGRFLRWNSWSILTHPQLLLHDCLVRIWDPLHHGRTWMVTIFFAFIMGSCFHLLKNILQNTKQQST
jgi:uncharacterized membrane protein